MCSQMQLSLAEHTVSSQEFFIRVYPRGTLQKSVTLFQQNCSGIIVHDSQTFTFVQMVPMVQLGKVQARMQALNSISLSNVHAYGGYIECAKDSMVFGGSQKCSDGQEASSRGH